MRNFNYRTMMLCLTGLLLGGCSLMQSRPASMTSYTLDVQLESSPANAGKLALLVSTPSAQAGFNSSRMIYIKREHEIGFFAQHQWLDSPARMLEPLLIHTLEHSGQYRAVLQQPNSAQADIRLDTEILRFQQEFLTLPSRIHLTLRAQLIDVRGKSVIATHTFDVTEIAPEDSPYGGVIAANRAVKALLQQIADFSARAIKSAEYNHARPGLTRENKDSTNP